MTIIFISIEHLQISIFTLVLRLCACLEKTYSFFLPFIIFPQLQRNRFLLFFEYVPCIFHFICIKKNEILCVGNCHWTRLQLVDVSSRLTFLVIILTVLL